MARSRNGRPLERILPFGYVGLAIALAAVLLPTILRPPQDLQNASAAFSPDAPPDEPPPEALLQSLRQASSSTAGSKPASVEEVVIEEAAPPPPPPQKKAVRAGCFGDPPRQTESLYSALCVPAWTGTDNGGATARGVTADEIKIAIGVDTATTIETGKLQRDPAADDQETERLLKVWQAYFNERFEFYGRYLQFYIYKVSGSDEDQARGVVRQAATDGMFAFIDKYATTNAATTNEAIKNQLITFAFDFNPAEFYKDGHPYAYSFEMDSHQLSVLSGEYLCKHWIGKPPGEFNEGYEDGVVFRKDQPRRWGLIVYQDELRKGAVEKSRAAMKRCKNTEYAHVVEYNLNDDTSKIAGSVAQMRAANVTSIIVGVDPITPAVLTAEAERIGYFPEWYCSAGCSTNGTGRLMDNNQAEHMVTFSSEEIPRADADKDWYRAYKEIDPEGEPDYEYFRDLQQLSGGIQHAGTNLTADSFWQGLKTQPCRVPDPIWSIGGCYRDPDPTSNAYLLGDYTYSDYASFMWFDNAGDDPDSSSAGAWCYMNMGARYKIGEVPDEPLPFRKPESCIFTPPRGVQG